MALVGKPTGLLMKLPQFVPILTAFTARVAGRGMEQLLQSPSALARALADTQTVVGHDGVLCVFDPVLVSSSCLAQHGAGLTPAEEIPQTAPVAAILESIQPLRHHLPESAGIYATFAGPGLLSSQLQDAFDPHGANSVVDPDYVVDVILSVVRSALDLKADGIALIERGGASLPLGLLRVHKKARKLADFYDAGFLVFSMPGGGEPEPELPAHCIFDLASAENGIGPVIGKLAQSAASKARPSTTAGDVPESTPVEDLKRLLQDGKAA
jgi:hypothetical protein